jgi:hypothetical protein
MSSLDIANFPKYCIVIKVGLCDKISFENSDIDISYTFKIMNQFKLKISLNLHGNISIEKEVVPKNQKFISVSKRQQPFIALYSY